MGFSVSGVWVGEVWFKGVKLPFGGREMGAAAMSMLDFTEGILERGWSWVM